jgi:hypothetical protein
MGALGGTYNTGTVSVTNGATSVVGTSVMWSDIEEGDWLWVGGVVSIIDSVDPSLVILTLKDPWPGGTNAAANYRITKMSWLRYEPALVGSRLKALLDALSSTAFLFVSGTVPDPGLGSDGQFALKVNDGSFLLWKKVSGQWVLQASPMATVGNELLLLTAR